MLLEPVPESLIFVGKPINEKFPPVIEFHSHYALLFVWQGKARQGKIEALLRGKKN